MLWKLEHGSAENRKSLEVLYKKKIYVLLILNVANPKSLEVFHSKSISVLLILNLANPATQLSHK